jgi:hypothetical protein
MSIQSFIGAIEKGLAFVNSLKPLVDPLAGLAGPGAVAIVNAVSTVAGLADAALAHAQDAANLVSAQDLATVRALQAKVQAEGDALSVLTDAS